MTNTRTKFRHVQNFAARILSDKRKFDYITPNLQSLRWLPVADVLMLKDEIMIFKSMNFQNIFVPGFHIYVNISITITPGSLRPLY